MISEIFLRNNSSNSLLDSISDVVRGHVGLTGKQAISSLREYVDTSDPIHGSGDDGAVVDLGEQKAIVCGEAISPPFVKSDPYGAGIASVVANVNDVAAMGGIPKGIVNTVVAPPGIAPEIMRGMSAAANFYDVPIVGGHLTESDGDVSLSAFAIGHAERILSLTHLRPGQVLMLAWRLFRILCQRKNTRSIRSQIECSIKPAFKEDGQLR